MPAFKGDKGDQGISILKVEQTTTSSESSGENIITVTLTNGQKFNFSMRNGAKGDTGNHGGIQAVTTSETPGFISVTKQDGTIEDISIGAALNLMQDSTTTKSYVLGTTSIDDMDLKFSTGVYVDCANGVLYGAAWNDYAEFRDQNESIEPGYVVYCDDDGKVKKTTKKLQKFEGVVSDTYGFSIGETDTCKTPLAVSGRVLVYADPEEEHFHSGDAVCAGPDGLIYRMTREEIMEFPDRIVGIVSEIPTYEIWGTNNVPVNGRIWIKVR